MAFDISRVIQIALTIFYGQLLAVAIYDLIIYGSNDLNRGIKTEFYFNLSRVVIGPAMIACSIFSLILIWRKLFRALFISGVILSLISIAYVVTYTVYLSFNYDSLDKNIKYPLVVEFVVKASMMAIASFMTFFLATRSTYLYLHVNSA
jgi:hypothetical protein